MARSIGDALREYADNQEHAEYHRRALEIAKKYQGQPFTMRALVAIQCDLDFAYRQCCITAGRKLRRLTAEPGEDSGTLLLTSEPFEPASYGNRGE